MDTDKTIKLIVFDFDGVMTDNRVLVDENGKEAVWVNRSDGLGIQMLKEMGYQLVILSTETNKVVEMRAQKLKIEVFHGVKDKADGLRKISVQKNVNLNEVMYVGNDINDLPAMRLAGIKVTPNDAYQEVKDIADIILNTKGGYGVVRELAALLGKGKENGK